MTTGVRCCTIALALLGACAARASEESSLLTAVHARTVGGYQRPRAPDGGFKREYYALANGGALPGTTLEQRMEHVGFPQLAGVLGQYLATQNYFLAPNEASADLLLVVHWGATGQTSSTIDTNLHLAMSSGSGSAEDIQILQQMRDRVTAEHAQLLGYAEEMHAQDDYRRFVTGSNRYNDLRSEVEEPRYYLVVSAYDFRETVRKKNRKLLWVTRVSIRSPGNSFAGEFSEMIAKAARHFGRDVGLLRRDELEARVEIGEMEVLGVAPAVPFETPAKKETNER